MKRRLTYLVADGQSVDFHRSSDGIKLGAPSAAREDRLTLALDELPREVQIALQGLDTLNIKWVAPQSQRAESLFLSALPIGFHVFYSPSKASLQPSSIGRLRLVAIFEKLLGINLNNSIALDSYNLERSVASFERFPRFQYYTDRVAQHYLRDYIRHKLCANPRPLCTTIMADERSYDNIDIDFIKSSQALKITMLRASADPQTEQHLGPQDSSNALEVGIFKSRKPADNPQISLEGVLLQPNKDDQAPRTEIAFRSRHASIINNHFQLTAVEPSGLHPTVRLQFAQKLEAPAPHCSLHAYMTLPAVFFIDKYSLSQPNYIKSLHIAKMTSLLGATDLEAPEWAVAHWGSTMLLELDASAVNDAVSYNVDIPLHLRYTVSSATSATTHAERLLAQPTVFWTCMDRQGVQEAGINPFDRINLGFDWFFDNTTTFYYLRSNSTADPSSLVFKIPVLDSRHGMTLEYGTAGTMLMGFAFLVIMLIRVAQSRD